MNSRMQIHKALFQVLPILLPGQPVYARSRIPLQPEERRPQQINVDMVK